MKYLWKCLAHCTAVVGVSTCMTTSIVAQDAAGAGIVRITKAKSPVAAAQARVTQVSLMQVQSAPAPGAAPTPINGAPAATPTANSTGCGPTVACQNCLAGETFDTSCPRCRRRMRRFERQANGGGLMGYRRGVGGGAGWDSCDGDYCDGRCHSCCSHEAMCDYFRCKFGYFIPSGAGGQGLPWVGCYSRVYPQDPYYRDSRDGQAWAAQGYGVPIAVPLAPVVGHAYDYSWGVPSSRLTPISNPAY